MSGTDDVVALWRLQARYADVVTRRAWPELHEVFRPDTEVHVDTVTAPVRVLVGPDQFGEFVAGSIERYDHFSFVILNPVVDLDRNPHPDQADGRFFMCEIRHEAATDTWSTAHGVYQDQYVRHDDHWWIAHRNYRSMARTGPTPAILGLPPDLGPLG